MRLRCWHVANASTKVFYVDVPDLETAIIVLMALINYDLYLDSVVCKDAIKFNSSGLEYWYERGKEWTEWYDEEQCRDVHEVIAAREEEAAKRQKSSTAGDKSGEEG